LDDFLVERVFLDITDSTLSPKQTKTYPATNSNITVNTITSSVCPPDAVREITYMEIIPPMDANLNYEDLREVWLTVDGHSTQHYLNISGVGDTLMTPHRSKVWSGRRFAIPFGEPLWSVVSGGTNMPIRNTTIKYANKVELNVATVNGVTGAGSGGWRVILSGYQYSAAALAQLSPKWDGTVNVQTMRRTIDNKPPLSFTFPMVSGINLDTFTTMPGGVNQGATKVWPYWHFAYNNAASQQQNAYAFTNLNALEGASGNVEDPFQDLGLEFAQNNNAFILRGFGIKGVGSTPMENVARFGWIVNGNIFPELTGNQGLFVSYGVNNFAFGATSPYIPVKGMFMPLPKFPGQLLIYKDNAVPFVGANGSPIPADSVVVAYNGVMVERG